MFRGLSLSLLGFASFIGSASAVDTIVLKGHTDSVNGVAFSSDGKFLASASDDDTILLWDVAEKKVVVT